MIANKIITKEKFRDYLDKTFINKDDIILLMYLFYLVKDVKMHEKIMFLLYNEYFTIDEVLDCIKPSSDGTYNNVTERIQKDIIDVASEYYDIDFENPYKNMKTYYFRDYVTTLIWKYYKSIENIEDQMEMIYDSLTATEKEFLNDVFCIGRDNLINLIRTQTDNNKISLSDIETYHNKNDEMITFKGILTNTTNITSITKGDYYFIQEDYSITTTKKYYKYQFIYAKKDSTTVDLADKSVWETHVTLANISDILNRTFTNNKDYYYVLDKNNDSSADYNASFSMRDLLLSILNKIYTGTIHYN